MRKNSKNALLKKLQGNDERVIQTLNSAINQLQTKGASNLPNGGV